jgi:hypothetical protein
MTPARFLLAVLLLGFCSVPAHADSMDFTITLDVLAASSPTPTPVFGIASVTPISGCNCGSILEFTVTPQAGDPAETMGLQLAPNFSFNDPVYFCEGCNPPYPLTGTSIPQLPGSLVLYIPDEAGTGYPTMDEVDGAFPPVPDYYVYGILDFAPDPQDAPEPACITLLAIGLAAFFIAKYRLRSALC